MPAFSIPRLRLAALAVACLAAACTSPDPAPVAEPPVVGVPADSTGALAAAREVIAAARYATLVTIGPDGHPQARIMDPFPPEEDFTIWLATNPRSRKVAEIARDPRVTLLYFDREGASYVTVAGEATAVDDPATKARYWKTEWAEFYPGGPGGTDYLLLRVTPHRLEVSAEHLGIRNDVVTWQPVIVPLR